MISGSGRSRLRKLKVAGYVRYTEMVKLDSQVRGLHVVLPYSAAATTTSDFIQRSQILLYEAPRPERSQIRECTHADANSAHQDLKTSYKKQQYPDTVSETAAKFGLRWLPTRNSIFLPHRKPNRSRMQTNTMLSARALAASRPMFRYEQHRFASSFASHGPERSHTASAESFIGNVLTENEGQNIRDHLRQWKNARDSSQNSDPSLLGGTLSRSPMMMMDTANSGQEDNLEPEEDADDVFQDYTTSTHDLLDAMTAQVFLRPGDLVDVKIHGIPLIAIVVREAEGAVFTYTERGTWHTVPPSRIRFSVPNMVSPHDVSGLSAYVTAFLEGKEAETELLSIPIAPRDAGSALVAKMARFHQESDAVFRKYADRLARAYEILSHAEPGAYISISLEIATMRLLEKNHASELTPTMLLIVHRTLNRTQNVLQSKFQQLTSLNFKLLPKRSLKTLEHVKKWVRNFQEERMRTLTEPLLNSDNYQLSASLNPLAKFAVKARRIISFSRQNRPLSPSGTLGPSLAQSKLDEQGSVTPNAYEKYQENFSHDEQQIIEFLAAWALSRHLNRASKLDSLGSTILRATQMYQNLPLDRFAACTMLQEMGIIKPWERIALFDIFLELPKDDMRDPTTLLLNQARRSVSHPSFHLDDAMSEYRKSSNGSRVLCIDSQGTQEVDDGFSLELIDGDENSCWIHVHIANPSAFVSHDSPVGRYARHAAVTAYFPEDKYPMMEDELSSKQFSLGNGRPCITFSARVSTEGDVVETKISHEILEDVHHITYQDAAHALQYQNHEDAKGSEIPFLITTDDQLLLKLHNSSPHTLEKGAKMDGTDTDMLKKLHNVSQALQRKRLRNGAFLSKQAATHEAVYPKVSIPSSLPSSLPGQGGLAPTVHAQRSRHFAVDPVISIERHPKATMEATDMVAEFMLLAGHTSAMWCSERNVPIVYRGVMPHPDMSPEPEVHRREAMDLAERAQSSHVKPWEYRRVLGVPYNGACPVEHTYVGLPVYCKSTSPLRRYSDIFNHWQIEAAIRHENSSGKSLVGSSPDLFDITAVLPFSYLEVEEVARIVTQREKAMRVSTFKAQVYWKIQALYRAFYFHQGDLPASFKVEVNTLPERTRRLSMGELAGWRLKAKLVQTPASDLEEGFRDGDVWAAKLVHVNPLDYDIALEPFRLIHRREVKT